MVIATYFPCIGSWKNNQKPHGNSGPVQAAFIGEYRRRILCAALLLCKICIPTAVFFCQCKKARQIISYANDSVEKITAAPAGISFVLFHFTPLSNLCQYNSYRNYFFHNFIVRHLPVILTKRTQASCDFRQKRRHSFRHAASAYIPEIFSSITR